MAGFVMQKIETRLIMSDIFLPLKVEKVKSNYNAPVLNKVILIFRISKLFL